MGYTLINDKQWDFYSALPNPKWYDDSDDQTEGDEGQVIFITKPYIMKVYAVFTISDSQGETLQALFKEEKDAEKFAFDLGLGNKKFDSIDILDYEVQ